MTTFKIISNPLRLFKKNEVWVKGQFPVQNAAGYLENRQLVKLVKTFRTINQAESYISYQNDMREFKETLID